MNEKKKILLFADWYAPGYKAGGPIRSCVNFAHSMRDQYDLYVFTADRDLGADRPYEQIRTDEWFRSDERFCLYYGSPASLTWRNIRNQLGHIQPDFIYLNSMFSARFTIFPLLIARLYGFKGKIVLSPRGMLRSSAVQFKPAKKKIFLRTFRLLRLSRYVNFLASDLTEEKDVRRYFGAAVRVACIPNFPAAVPDQPVIPEKKKGQLSLIYVGRVHPIKNTDYLLDVLSEVGAGVRAGVRAGVGAAAPADIRLTIVGSLEDKAFWETCTRKIARLPANIRVEYAGELPHHELRAIIAGHHIFVLPTRGENFGHAIYEALTLGKPVLISDQTPWRNLTIAKAGWDLPLQEPEAFCRAIGQAAGFDQQEYADWCAGTRAYVENYLAQLHLKEEYLKLFS
jgi:glycosyltransferase involved in cell wall biosynthesis